MPKKPRKPLTNAAGDVRTITAVDFKHFKPAHEVVPGVVAAWHRSRGRPAKPAGARKESVTIRLDPDILAWFKTNAKQSRQQYQTGINDALRSYVSLQGWAQENLPPRR
jgi:uncharacterized protein (DUF4415 family)